MTGTTDSSAVLTLQDLLAPDLLQDGNRKLLQFWLEIRGDCAMPSRSQFSPRHLSALLAHICLFDVCPGKDVVFRLVGTAISGVLGMDPTGLSLKPLTPPADWPYRLAAFDRIVAGAAFVGMHLLVLNTGQEAVSQELILPFSDVRDGVWHQAVSSNDFMPPGYRIHADMPQDGLHLTTADRFYAI